MSAACFTRRQHGDWGSDKAQACLGFIISSLRFNPIRGARSGESSLAAVALANGFAVATRDTLPFEAAGVNVINPWQACSKPGQ